MFLYHNADLKDINDIIEQGLLPMSATENNRWASDKRADNSIDVVYLFKPLGKQNSFTKYGMVLIEVEVDNAKKSSLPSTDKNFGKYDEYIVSHVDPKSITRIFIPSIFMDRITDLSESTMSKLIWCEMDAEVFSEYIPNPDDPYGYGGTSVYKPVTDKELAMFAGTAPIYVDEFNYFRGIDESDEMIDLYNVVYKF